MHGKSAHDARSLEMSSRGDQGELTSIDYWNQHWAETPSLSGDGQLAWIQASYPYQALDRLLRATLPVDTSKTFIELGSGPARWMIYFHKRFGYRVHGCDTSPLSCDLGRRNLAAAGVGGTVEQTDFFRLDGAYDVVFSAGVVEHFGDPLVPLRAFAGLVRPGGFLITDVPSLTGLNGWYHQAFKPETFETHRPVRLRELRRVHSELGLTELLATSYGSFCLTRLPADAFRHRPSFQRVVWRPAHRVATGAVNRVCVVLHRLRICVDHPTLSPHVLVISRRPGEIHARPEVGDADR